MIDTPSNSRQYRWPLILPKDIEGVRCALINTHVKEHRAIGLGRAIQRFHRNFSTYSASDDQVARVMLDKDTQLRIKRLTKEIGGETAPTRHLIVPEGSLIWPGQVALVMECDNEKWPWLPMAFNEFVGTINLTSRFANNFGAFQDTLRYYANTVPEELRKEEMAFKVRSEVEEFIEPEGSPIRSGLYPYFPGSAILDQTERADLEYDVPWMMAGEWDLWGATAALDNDVLKRRSIATFDVNTLRKLGLWDVSILANHLSTYHGSVALELQHGYHQDEIPEVAHFATELSEKIRGIVYVKPEGIPRGKDERPLQGEGINRYKPSELYSVNAQALLSNWHQYTPTETLTVNSVGYRRTPWRLLVPYPKGNAEQNYLLNKLQSKKKSLECIDFYLPYKTAAFHTSTIPFSYEIIALKRKGEWKPVGKYPVDMRMVFDNKAKVHVTLNPDDILEELEGDSLKPDMLEPVMLGEVEKNLITILKLHSGHGPYVEPEQKDPLLQ